MNILFRLKTIGKRFLPNKVRQRLRAKVISKSFQKIIETRQPWGDDTLQSGITMIGDFKGASGLSEAARGLSTAMDYANMPHEMVHFYDRNSVDRGGTYEINLICTNPNLLAELLLSLPRSMWFHRYQIGMWFWEQEHLPQDWIEILDLFDEIWVGSTFTADAVRRVTEKPVTVIPCLLNAQSDPNRSRTDFGIAEDLFLVLLAFDCHSVPERKNPRGGIEAFCKGFEDVKDRVGMVIKIRNGTPAHRQELQDSFGDFPHLFFVEEDLPKEEMNRLIELCDVYLSLHRAEGFGLVLAEAMCLGTAVVATNWSATTEFMNPEVSCLVDAKLVTLEKDHIPFQKGSRWADPDLNQASAYLRYLYDNPTEKREMELRATQFIKQYLGIEKIAGILSQRLLEITMQKETQPDKGL